MQYTSKIKYSHALFGALLLTSCSIIDDSEKNIKNGKWICKNDPTSPYSDSLIMQVNNGNAQGKFYLPHNFSTRYSHDTTYLSSGSFEGAIHINSSFKIIGQFTKDINYRTSSSYLNEISSISITDTLIFGEYKGDLDSSFRLRAFTYFEFQPKGFWIYCNYQP